MRSVGAWLPAFKQAEVSSGLEDEHYQVRRSQCSGARSLMTHVTNMYSGAESLITHVTNMIHWRWKPYNSNMYSGAGSIITQTCSGAGSLISQTCTLVLKDL